MTSTTASFDESSRNNPLQGPALESRDNSELILDTMSPADRATVDKIEQMTTGLQTVAPAELELWLRNRHKQMYTDDMDETRFANEVMAKIASGSNPRFNMAKKFLDILGDLQFKGEHFTPVGESLARILSILRNQCIAMPQRQHQVITISPVFEQIKAHIADRRWNNKGVGFMFFSKTPRHIVQLRQAQTFAEMKEIAQRALRTNPCFRHRSVRALYQAISTSADEEACFAQIQNPVAARAIRTGN